MRPAMIRSIDSQGRIIIPTEIRKTMHLSDGDALEIRTLDSGILLSKYTAHVRDPDMKKYLDILYSVIRCSAAICSEDYVIATRGISLAEGAAVSAQMGEYVRSGQPKVFDHPVYVTESDRFPVDTIIPLPDSAFSYQHMALLLFCNGRENVTEDTRLCAKIIAALIAAKTL